MAPFLRMSLVLFMVLLIVGNFFAFVYFCFCKGKSFGCGLFIGFLLCVGMLCFGLLLLVLVLVFLLGLLVWLGFLLFLLVLLLLLRLLLWFAVGFLVVLRLLLLGLCRGLGVFLLGFLLFLVLFLCGSSMWRRLVLLWLLLLGCRMRSVGLLCLGGLLFGLGLLLLFLFGVNRLLWLFRLGLCVGMLLLVLV